MSSIKKSDNNYLNNEHTDLNNKININIASIQVQTDQTET